MTGRTRAASRRALLVVVFMPDMQAKGEDEDHGEHGSSVAIAKQHTNRPC